MRKYQSYKIKEENNMKNKTAKILLAALTAATLTSMPVMAADASDYILLLPKTEGVTYEMAQDHVADQYSNDQYTVLLYKEGETVDLTVSGATDFVIKDAMDSDTTDYAASETDGKVSFTMPAEDLSLSVNNVSEEAVAAAKAAETESETQAQSETEAVQELNQGGSSQAVPSDIRIASARVNVRESADSNANKIAVLTPGQRVRVLSEENGWTRLQYVDENKNLVEGSVKSDYLTDASALYTAKANVNVRGHRRSARRAGRPRGEGHILHRGQSHRRRRRRPRKARSSRRPSDMLALVRPRGGRRSKREPRLHDA